MAYKLLLLLSSQIHNVFHVSLLRQHNELVTPSSPQLPLVSNTSTFILEPEAILDRRVVHNGNYRPKYKILVK